MSEPAGWLDDEVCPNCGRPVYEGDATVRCLCNGSDLRATIRRLEGVLDWLGSLALEGDLSTLEEWAVERSSSTRL